MKIKPFFAWLVVDENKEYSDTIHLTREEAIAEMTRWSRLVEPKWKVVKVRVATAPTRGRKA